MTKKVNQGKGNGRKYISQIRLYTTASCPFKVTVDARFYKLHRDH